MKRKVLLSVLAVSMVLISLCGLIIGCNKAKGEYSVTVLGLDEQPVKDVNVSWNAGGKTKGSATTDADGKAVATIELGTYEISLSNYEEGLAYPSVSVNSQMREVTIMLEVAKVVYTATVKDKTGAPAQGVTVSWRNGTSIAGTAVTDAQGVASKELDYGDYDVYVKNLPSGNVFSGSLPASGNAPNTQFNLIEGVTVPYSVTVVSEGGLKFADVYLSVYSGEVLATFGQTDENGVYNFELDEGEYLIDIDEIQDGYSKVNPVTKVTTQSPSAEMVLKSTVIDREPGNINYVIGDIIHDYEFVTKKLEEVTGSDGGTVYNVVYDKTYSIADLLYKQNKKAIFINNWGTDCSWCVKEMPAMKEAYEQYKDKIEIIAVSNYNGGDTEREIINFREQHEITFPMMRDTNGFASKFSLSSYPTTIVIDRYGAIARIEVGAILESEVWGRLFEKYIGDDYMQTFVPGTHESESINDEIAKPDITVDEDHYDNVASILNKFTSDAQTSVTYHGDTSYDYAWPFIFNETPITGIADTANTVLLASNGKRYAAGETLFGRPNSIAIIHATVKVPAGKVFTFKYYSDTEPNLDRMRIVWDGKLIKDISGDSNGWQTCYLYSDLTDDTHSLSITYVKDRSKNVGEDNVFIKDVQFEDILAVDSTLKGSNTSINMIRGMAYGTANEGDKYYPHYAGMTLGGDGYYHVNIDSLENHAYAGNDPSPMVFVNMLNASNWYGYSIQELAMGVDDRGEYVVDCTFTVNGVTKDWRQDIVKYCYIASCSDIRGFIPLDKDLHDLLIEFMKVASGSYYHSNEILEACYFYSHYGSTTGEGNEFIGNPLIGLTDKTAIELNGDDLNKDLSANLNRVIYPFTFEIFTFTAPADGVYMIESLIPKNDDGSVDYAAQIWLYDLKTYGEGKNAYLCDVDHPLIYCGDARAVLDGTNEHNFVIYRYMKQGEKYYLNMSFQMAQMGTLKFKITNVGDSITDLVPCSEQLYDGIFDADGKLIGSTLRGAIKYELGEDGYYYAINPDNSRGSKIYLNVGYKSLAVYTPPMKDLVNDFVRDPRDTSQILMYGDTADNLTKKIPIFDFSKVIVYGDSLEEGFDVQEIPLSPIEGFDLNKDFEIYKGYKKTNALVDYTDKMKDYIAKAGQNGNPEGLVPVTEELREILLLYLRMRNNSVSLNSAGQIIEWEVPAENEWLRFCWYNRTYNSTNP